MEAFLADLVSQTWSARVQFVLRAIPKAWGSTSSGVHVRINMVMVIVIVM